MTVYVVKGKGYGSTSLSAFDAALKDAGIYNYNLIVLSSIIPKNTVVLNKRFRAKKEEFGHRLYVVKSEKRSKELGNVIGAALGWYQQVDGRGTFVEHAESGRTEKEVESKLTDDVKNSIADLCKSRRFKFDKRKLGIKTSITKVYKKPACVLVLAAFQAEGWK